MAPSFIEKNLPRYIEWRHYLHRHPELSFNEHKTSDFIAEKLDSFSMGYERLGLGIVAYLDADRNTREVATKRGNKNAKDVNANSMNGNNTSTSNTNGNNTTANHTNGNNNTTANHTNASNNTTANHTNASNNTKAKQAIGLRADIDALPILEKNDFKHKSANRGVMHACGHDGHTTMLLAAAHYASQHKDVMAELDKDIYFIFQPAEEMGGGAAQMIKDGLFDKFPMQQVYGMHNWPGIDIGDFAICKGAIMAAVDFFDIKISGGGGHAAMPHLVSDTIVTATNIVTQLQTIVSRSIDPCDSLVISCTAIDDINEGDNAYNVIPAEVNIKGTMRYFRKEVHKVALDKMDQIVKSCTQNNNLTGEIKSYTTTTTTCNHANETEVAISAARQVINDGKAKSKNKVVEDITPSMGGEDFAYMLEAKPGSYIWMGNGDTATLHNSEYDFNDKALGYGISYWLNLMRS